MVGVQGWWGVGSRVAGSLGLMVVRVVGVQGVRLWGL